MTLSRSGTTTRVASDAQAMVAGPSTSPTPTRLPINACVVDTGRRVTVASTTQAVAPTSTERANAGVGRAVTMPVENSSVSAAATCTDTTEPARVVITPQASALRYPVTPAPPSVATPLGSSLLPLAAANSSVNARTAPVISWWRRGACSPRRLG
jgi:hypothetical protein